MQRSSFSSLSQRIAAQPFAAVGCGAGAILAIVTAVSLWPAFPLEEPAAGRAAPSASVEADKVLDPAAVRNGEATPLPTGRSVRAPELAADERDRMIGRGQSLLDAGDFAGARLFLQRAADAGSPEATFALAMTYDPNVLAERGAKGLVGEPDQARALYARAAAAGVAGARKRLAALGG